MLLGSVENFSCFETLTEPRRQAANFRHDLIDIIVIALCGTICYCDTWDDIEDFAKEREGWLKQYISLSNGIPSHDTIARTISALDTAEFFQCLQQWIDQWSLDLRGRGIHIDGKTARGSRDVKNGLGALHMVSAWVDELNVCLGQLATEEKSNEITAVPALLDLIDIKGAVVTLDALNCQRKTVDKIIDKKADYIIAVKNNQPTLYDEIADAFIAYQNDDCADRSFRSHRTVITSNGRKTETLVTVAPLPKSIKATGKWTGAKSIVRVFRQREASPGSKKIPQTATVAYFISSLRPTASLIAGYLGKHWSVENTLHWTLDVTFTEDRRQIRRGNSPAIMASLRRFVLSLLKRDTSMPKTSLKRKRLRAALNTDTLEAVLFGV